MKHYEIRYSTAAGGSMLVEAKSEDDAIDQFDAIAFEDLFDLKDLYRGIEIDDIEEIKEI